MAHAAFPKNGSPKFLVVIILFVHLTSCKLMYFPTAHNTPMLSQKGELQISALTDISSCFDIQTAYAVSNNLGIMLNGNYRGFWNYSTGIDDADFKPQTYAEAGLGYYNSFGDNAIFEVYGGGGVGNVNGFIEVNDPYELKAVSGTLTKFFIQPAIGTSFERKFLFKSTIEYDFAFRLSAVNLLNETRFFAEPGFVAKIGGKTVRFVYNVGYSIPLHKHNTDRWIHNPYIVGIGMQVSFGRLFEKE